MPSRLLRACLMKRWEMMWTLGVGKIWKQHDVCRKHVWRLCPSFFNNISPSVRVLSGRSKGDSKAVLGHIHNLAIDYVMDWQSVILRTLRKMMLLSGAFGLTRDFVGIFRNICRSPFSRSLSWSIRKHAEAQSSESHKMSAVSIGPRWIFVCLTALCCFYC